MTTPIRFPPTRDTDPHPPRPREARTDVTNLVAHRDRLVMRAEASGDDFSSPIPGLNPSIDVALVKGDRVKRFWIRPGREDGEWFCQVFWGRMQHRGERTDETQAVRRRTEFKREITDLVADGWMLVPVEKKLEP